MSLMDGLELYICLILTVEFIYDYWWNSREQRLKRRKKKQPEFDQLNQGESK
jgi:hypothetical protein